MITYKVTVDEYGATRWYNEKGELHRLDGPAVEYADGSKEWLVNDLFHRLDGPARVYSDGCKIWCIEGMDYTEDEFNAKIETMKRPCKGKKIVVDGVEYTLA